MQIGRKFDSLTNDEIKRFLNMEFNLNKDISDKDIICYGDEIDIKIYMMTGYPDISAKVTLSIDGIKINDFNAGTESFHWQQYLLSKGIHPLLENNPYLQNNEDKER